MIKIDFENLIAPKLPETPGIYLFKKGEDLLYVGKATSLRSRVRSYFSNDLIKTRGRLLVDMITLADKIDFQETDSVLEALILEAQFIKENQPKYNTKDKDNKSYNYVVITDEDFPKVLVMRGRNLEQNLKQNLKQKLKQNLKQGLKQNLKQNSAEEIEEKKERYKYTFGPYPYGGELKEAIKLIRKIFPFRDKCTPFSELKISAKVNPRPCFNRTIGLCPGVCTGEISKKDYSTQIKNIKMFFEGKKPLLLKSLEKQMKVFAKEKEFEKAGLIKRTIFALNHIQDVSLIKRVDSEDIVENLEGLSGGLSEEAISQSQNDQNTQNTQDMQGSQKQSLRIEAYDIAHMSGQNMVGAMVVMENGELSNGLYRKFIIRGFEKANDPGALAEMIKRRANHPEWGTPNIIVLDGNEVQLKRAYETWTSMQASDVLFCSVVKDQSHNANEVLFLDRNGGKSGHDGKDGQKGNGEKTGKIGISEKVGINNWKELQEKFGITELGLRERIVKINAEAHRFAIAFHKNRRGKSFLG